MSKLLSIFSLLIIAFSVKAQESPFLMPPVEHVLNGDHLYNAYLGYRTWPTESTVKLPHFVQGNTAWELKSDHRNVKNRIALKIYTELNQADFDFSIEVPLEITLTNEDFSEQTIQYHSLEVNYNHAQGSSFKQIDLLELLEGYKMNVNVNHEQLNILPSTLSDDQKLLVANAIKLSSSIHYEEIGHFFPENILRGYQIEIEHLVDENQIEICWDPILGAIEYDLEWTEVERYFSGIGWTRANFEKSASRVTLKANCYTMPNVFERVGLVFRIRAKGHNPDDELNLLIGDWSCSDPSGQCNDYSDIRAYSWSSKIDLSAHESDKLNWQIVSSYAENGKRKDVITYMDGTMRSRQTVTAINSDENALVAETIYDYQGRPAIQTLPAPLYQDIALKFRQNFNQNLGHKPYSKEDFDLDAPNCGLDNVPPMADENNGAAHYYSDNYYNNLDPQDIAQKPHLGYIPSSEGYPFVQTEYTSDNTGRIARQGGAGPQYQLGSGHETKYFYGVPTQEELDLLFGTNVGFANHYKKNMVVDPNGQVSISYMDAKGNTIATSLAGQAPKNDDGEVILSQLDSYAPREIEVDLMKFNKKYTNENSLTAVYTLLVEEKANYSFSYNMMAAQFRDECMPENSCYDCYYDFDIKVVQNSCGEIIYSQEVRISEFPADPDSINVICGDPLEFEIDTINTPDFKGFILEDLEIGDYSIIKTLRVDESIADAYVEHYINDALNECTNLLEDLLLEELALVDTTDCSIQCDELDASTMTTEEQEAWEEMLCDTLPSTPCEVARSLMIADLMPGGQYGQVDFSDNTTYEFPLSIYNPDNMFGSGDVSSLSYDPLDFIDLNGVQKGLNDCTLLELINGITEVFVEKYFLEYHPEHCYLARCDNIISSHDYDIVLGQVDTYQEALDNGWINVSSSVNGIYNLDPYPGLSVPTSAPTNFMSNFLTQLDNYNGQGLSILQIAIQTVFCPSELSQDYLNNPSLLNDVPPSGFVALDDYNECLSTFDLTTASDDDLDEVWLMYRALYLSVKNDIEYVIRTYNAIEENCYNECIGQENFNPFVSGFITAPWSGPFLDLDQVCNLFEYPAYSSKQKRFPSVYDIMPNMNVDIYNPETDITEIWQNVIENTDQEYLNGCEECNNYSSYINALNQIIAADYFPNYVMDNFHDHGDLVHSLVDLTDDFSFIELFYWNPDGVANWNGLKVVFDQSCEFAFGSSAQVSNTNMACGFNYISNPNFEYGMPTATDQDIDNADGWKAIWPSGSIADFFGTDSHTQSFGLPGQWGGFWVSHTSNINFREGMMNELHTTINPNDGPYNFTFDVAKRSTGGSGEPILSVYGVYNPSNSYSATPISKDNPSNIDLFGMQNTVHLGDISIDIHAYNTYVSKDLSFDPSQLAFPSNGITHLLFLANDAHNSGQRYIFIDNLKLCKANNLALNYEIESFNSLNPISDGSSNYEITVEYQNSTYEELNLNTDCDFSCDESSLSLLKCQTLPEAKDFLRFLNSFHWRQTGSSGSVTHSTNIANIGDDLQSEIGIDTVTGQYPFTSNIYLDSIVIEFYEGCNVTLNLGREASQFGTNDIHQFGNIVADFSQIDSEGFTDHFSIAYRNKDDIWATVTGYTNGCFHVGYCCPENSNGGAPPPSPPKPTIPKPSTWPPKKEEIGQTSNARKMASKKKLLPKKKKVIKQEDVSVPIDPIIFSGTEINLGDTETRPVRNLEAMYCNPCGLEVTGGIWQDTIFGRPCEDVWCRDSIPVIYQTDLTGECIDQLYAVAEANAYIQYEQYIDSIRMDVKARYLASCLDAKEEFNANFAYSQHHFTLYYYDQANNLVQTVPPNGVETLDDSEVGLMADYRADLEQYKNDIVASAIDNTLPIPIAPTTPITDAIVPSWASEYKYNSLNQLTDQKIPDQGFDNGSGFEKEPTVFWYDDLGRLVASQNPEQAQDKEYSYTLYDGLGRIRETGEVISGSDPDNSNHDPIQTGIYKDGVIENAESSWMSFLSGTRTQVTSTTYDEPYYGNIPPISFPNLTMDNLRGRVAAAAYYESFPQIALNDPDFVTHYSYDIHGNVKYLIQQPKGFSPKTIEYNYDLLSGNVNYVWYQRDKIDQFTHRYSYDADNRLTLVKTSRDGILWDEDAHYIYYPNGPLARLELGEEEVQGLDYAYTLQGWIKGMNSAVSKPEFDIGQDGVSGHHHENFPRDEVGFTLNYNTQDFTPTGASNFHFDSDWNSQAMSPELWNGNIRSMITSIRSFMPDGNPAAYSYTYDQLNRIKSMQHHNNFDPISNTWQSPSPSGDYSSSYTYDANGNIRTLNRDGLNSTGMQKPMDAFNYTYTSGNNQLGYVDDDLMLTGNFDNDIDDQESDNYLYDRLGNLIKDVKDSITNISWNLSGKVAEIEKLNGNKIKFKYDALGNRIAKQVDNKITYYIRDASGNTMAHYKSSLRSGSGLVLSPDVYLESLPLYGSARLGMYQPNKLVGGPSYAQGQTHHIGGNDDVMDSYDFERGQVQYELSNHLGNVLATIADRKQLGDDSYGEEIFVADVRSASDYYPFGMKLNKLSFDYNFSFNAKENFKSYTLFEQRAYNSQIGSFLSIDSKNKLNPSLSPYTFASLNPIKNIDFQGEFTSDANMMVLISNSYDCSLIGMQKIGDWNVVKANSLEEAMGILNSHKIGKSSLDNVLLVNHGTGQERSNLSNKETQLHLDDDDHDNSVVTAFAIQKYREDPNSVSEKTKRSLDALSELSTYLDSNSKFVFAACGGGSDNLLRNELNNLIVDNIDGRKYDLWMNNANSTIPVLTTDTDKWSYNLFNKKLIKQENFDVFGGFESNEYKQSKFWGFQLNVSLKNPKSSGVFKFKIEYRDAKKSEAVYNQFEP